MGFYTESARQLINPMDVPTFMIECAQTERKLFEGLIELDFAEVYCESGLAVLTEEEKAAANDAAKKSFGQVMSNLWNKFLETIKNLKDKFVGALKEFAERTSNILKNKSALDSPKAKSNDFTAKDLLYSDYKEYSKADEWIKTMESISKQCEEVIRNPENKEKLDEMFKNFTIGVDDMDMPTTVAEWDAWPQEKKNKYPGYAPKELKTLDYNKLKDTLGLSGLIKDIEDLYKVLTMKLNWIDTKSDDPKVQSTLESVAKAITHSRLKLFSAYGAVVRNTAKIARRNFSTIADFVNGGSKKEEEGKEEVQNNSAILSSLSDLFCESVFEEY